MTDQSALLALADKLEKATGPSRELDRAIGAVTGYPPQPTDAGVDANLRWMAGLPRYTASIDAALTLVPEGFSGSVYFGAGPLQVANVNCHICGPDVNVSEDHTGIAPTSPLALCAAALRARAA